MGRQQTFEVESLQTAKDTLRALERQVKESNANLNVLLDIYEQFSNADCRVVFFAINAMERCMVHLMNAMPDMLNTALHKKTESATPSAVNEALIWLHERYRELRRKLFSIVRDEPGAIPEGDAAQQQGLRVTAMHSIMRLLAGAGLAMYERQQTKQQQRQQQHTFDNATLRELLAALLALPGDARVRRVKHDNDNDNHNEDEDEEDDNDNDNDEALLAEFVEHYAERYADVRFYTLSNVQRMCDTAAPTPASGGHKRKRRSTPTTATDDAPSPALAVFQRRVFVLLQRLAPPLGADHEPCTDAMFVPLPAGSGGAAQRDHDDDDDDDDDSDNDDPNNNNNNHNIDDASLDEDDVAALPDDFDLLAPEPVERPAKRRRAERRAAQRTRRQQHRLATLKAHRHAFGGAWLAFLRTPLERALLHRALRRLVAHVLRFLPQPLLLCDLLSAAFARGGEVALLALHALFVLITEFNLDYPKFYEQVYSLFQPGIFTSKHRGAFVARVATFLASPLLPAATAAAFIKRTLRLAVLGPPSAALLAVPLAYNVVRRHPTCLKLVHRRAPATAAGATRTLLVSGTASASSAALDDRYDATAADPALANALHTSLWELEALRAHYHHNVARIVQLFEQPIVNQDQALEAVLQIDYASLARDELKRRVKQKPAVAFGAAPVLFDDTDAACAVDEQALIDELQTVARENVDLDDEL